MKDEIKEILEDVKRHLDYVEATKYVSIRDNEMKVMYDHIINLQEENEKIHKDFAELSERYFFTKSRNEKLEPYEDYFKNVVKPKVLKGEEDTLDNKWKRLIPTVYREIIKEQQDKIDKAAEVYKNRNTCKYKKERFMEDKSTSDLMYETLTGGDE